MHIYIDNRSGAPIYDQIKTQIKAQIMAGELLPDELLPSIRGLAKDLRISFITTKRAYDDLEAEGFLYTVPGKGCFVAARNTELLREENLKKIEEHLEEIVRLLEKGDAPLEDSIKLFEEGTKLAKKCDDMLNEAEKKVVVLSKGEDGAPAETEFDIGE